MRVLINNTVKTNTSDYVFPTREEAEAFYMTLKSDLPLSRKHGTEDDLEKSQPKPKRRPDSGNTRPQADSG